ncbi:MAG: hypothetical protein HYW57_07975 [Ignavibacteriales bacterium]|nr:hypothetical protein [Ignavibacteriales bacterium]
MEPLEVFPVAEIGQEGVDVNVERPWRTRTILGISQVIQVAGEFPVFRPFHQMRCDGIQVNVSHQIEEIFVRIDSFGAKPAFKEVAALSVEGVD